MVMGHLVAVAVEVLVKGDESEGVERNADAPSLGGSEVI